jgi:hypothetical protein
MFVYLYTTNAVMPHPQHRTWLKDGVAAAEQTLARTIEAHTASMTVPMSRLADGALAGMTQGRESMTAIHQKFWVAHLKALEGARADLGRMQAYRASRANAAAFYRGRATTFQGFLNGR